MYTLAFDTTVSSCSIALFEDRKEIDRFEKEMDFGQAEVLIPQIDAMLKRHQLMFNQLNLVVVCTGPGSFTGVRSSIAAARAFALACPDITVCGVSAFEAYVADFAAPDIAPVNAILIETKRDDFYVQYFDSTLNKLAPPKTALYEDIIHELQGKKVTFAGDGIKRFLSKPSGLSVQCVKMHFNPPIDKLAQSGINKYQNKNADFPKPLYLKAPDVCVK